MSFPCPLPAQNNMETFTCPDCKYIETWKAKEIANRGTPVCPNDDSDMLDEAETQARYQYLNK